MFFAASLRFQSSDRPNDVAILTIHPRRRQMSNALLAKDCITIQRLDLLRKKKLARNRFRASSYESLSYVNLVAIVMMTVVAVIAVPAVPVPIVRPIIAIVGIRPVISVWVIAIAVRIVVIAVPVARITITNSDSYSPDSD